MARKYDIAISDGVGTERVVNGDYSVTATSAGYDASSIDPSTVTISANEDTYSFTISASGNLTIHVTEEGTASGTAVSGAVFYRTDSEGNTYGNPITTDTSGNAILANVPYDATDAPDIYFKQTDGDQTHTFVTTVYQTTMSTASEIFEVTNPLAEEKTFNLVDANYNNLPIGTATLTLDESV